MVLVTQIQLCAFWSDEIKHKKRKRFEQSRKQTVYVEVLNHLHSSQQISHKCWFGNRLKLFFQWKYCGKTKKWQTHSKLILGLITSCWRNWAKSVSSTILCCLLCSPLLQTSFIQFHSHKYIIRSLFARVFYYVELIEMWVDKTIFSHYLRIFEK